MEWIKISTARPTREKKVLIKTGGLYFIAEFILTYPDVPSWDCGREGCFAIKNNDEWMELP